MRATFAVVAALIAGAAYGLLVLPTSPASGGASGVVPAESGLNVRVGNQPMGIVFDPHAREMFVANQGSNNVSVLDARSDQVVASVPVGQHPVGVAFDYLDHLVLVANHDSSTVSLLNDSSDRVVGTVAVAPHPVAVAYDNATGVAYVADFDANKVTSFLPATGTVLGTVTVGTHPDALLVDPVHGLLYVADHDNGPGTPPGAGQVTVVDTTTNAVVTTLLVGQQPDGLALDPAADLVFVANFQTNNLSVVTGSSDHVVAHVTVGQHPDAIVFDTVDGNLYVANHDPGPGSVTVLGARNLTVFETLSGTAQPTALAYDPPTGELWVTNGQSNSVLILSVLPLPRFAHVVVIVMEDATSPAFLAQSPYQRYLARTYGNATNFYGLCHGSYPNYLGMVNGEYTPCGSSSVAISGNRTLMDLLTAKGDSWMGYFESMPAPCTVSSSGLYAAYHNPFILFKDIRYYPSVCDAHVVNSSAFNATLANGTLPTVSFYVPNLVDDCKHAPFAFCDAWLRSFLSPILNSTNATVRALVNSTVFLLAHDESSSGSQGYLSDNVVSPWCQKTTGQKLSACGGHTYLVVISPAALGRSDARDATDFSIESTIEWDLGLGSDGGYDGTAAFPALTSLF